MPNFFLVEVGLAKAFETFLLSLALVFATAGAVAYFLWFERKFAGRIQKRVGPYYVGRPHGWLQPIADALKFLVKEDIRPKRADSLLFSLTPAVALTLALLPIAFVPIGGFSILRSEISLVIVLGVLAVLGPVVVFAGWSSGNKFSLVSAVREVAQGISYEIPLVVSALMPALWFGTLDIAELSKRTFFFVPFFGQIAFILFFISMLIELNRAPFDVAEAESELVAGYRVEFSGMKFAYFYLAEYVALFVQCAVAVNIFFGGANALYIGGTKILPAELWFAVKFAMLLVFTLLVRWTFLRLRIDKLISFCWKFVVPASLTLIFLCAFFKVA